MSSTEWLETRLRAYPDDWSAWRVYADQLPEGAHGEARRELLALEHRLATGALPAVERRALRQKRREILESHQGDWLSGLSFPSGTELRWRGGFVVGLNLGPGPVWLTLGPPEGWLALVEAL